MSGVMASRIVVVVGSHPSATARTVMSRSVSMPMSRSPSQTGSEPILSRRILAAACCSVTSGWMTSTSGVMISRRCIARLLLLRHPLSVILVSSCPLHRREQRSVSMVPSCLPDEVVAQHGAARTGEPHILKRRPARRTRREATLACLRRASNTGPLHCLQQVSYHLPSVDLPRQHTRLLHS